MLLAGCMCDIYVAGINNANMHIANVTALMIAKYHADISTGTKGME